MFPPATITSKSLVREPLDHIAAVAPGRPMFRKGAGSRARSTVLREIVRGEPAPF